MFFEAREVFRNVERQYQSIANNLEAVSSSLNQAQTQLRAAEAANNVTGARNASAEVIRLQAVHQIAADEESKASGKYKDANRKLATAQRTLVGRANGAMNFNRMFGIKYRDILAVDRQLETKYRSFQQRLIALNYNDFSSTASPAADSERKRVKLRQVELSMRIPISIEDIMETAMKHAEVR